MKAPVHVLRRSTRVWLLAGIIVVALLAVTSDRTPATAATTEIGPSLVVTGTSGCGSVCAPAWVSSVTLVKGGHMGTLNACWDGIPPQPTAYIDGATSCLYIWGKNVDATSTGASAFQIDIAYDSSKVHVAAIVGWPYWLGSAGRAASCLDGIVEEDPITGSGHAAVPCNTGFETGTAPNCPLYCNGLLATVQIETAPSAPVGPANFTIDFSNGPLGGSHMLDTVCTDHCGQEMPATVHSMTARIVKCANVIDDVSHVVRVDDIVYMVNHYRSHGPDYPNPGDPPSNGLPPESLPVWDERADLNASNRVLVDDITTGVNEYRKFCLP